jgi:hypothetical protein
MEVIDRQLEALDNAKEVHEQKYIHNIHLLDDKIERIEKQLERTKSSVKRDLLKRQLDWYESEIEKMDEAVGVIMKKINSEIERLKNIKTSTEEKMKNEKKSLDYNIQKIRECAKDHNVYRIVDALEFVANALEIIRDETRQT